ncbi:UNVERIFIED_CONTAM: hypothetical protein K2H54_006768 [Gekko kuhli]
MGPADTRRVPNWLLFNGPQRILGGVQFRMVQLDGCEGTPAKIKVPVEDQSTQANIQRHLEEVMMAIPEMVVRALVAELAAEQQRVVPPPGEGPPVQEYFQLRKPSPPPSLVQGQLAEQA